MYYRGRDRDRDTDQVDRHPEASATWEDYHVLLKCFLDTSACGQVGSSAERIVKPATQAK